MPGGLAEAKRALAAGDDAAALDALLNAWRETHAPALAALVAALGARMASEIPDVPAAGFHRAWLAIAARREAIDLPRLLASLLVPNARFGVQVVAELAERVASLAEWPPDPRTGDAVVAMLQTAGYEAMSTSNQPAWRGLLELVAAHGDPRAIDALAALRFRSILGRFSDRKKMATWMDAQVAATVARMRASARSPRTVDRATCTALRGAIAKRPTKRGDALAARDGEILATVPALPPPRARATAPSAHPAGGDPSPHLAAASRAVRDGDDARVLDELLAAWRLTRAPAIAALVEAASARLPRPAIDPGGDATRKQLQAAWLAIATNGDAADWPRLLDALLATHKRATDALARLDAVASWPADPRTARGVAGMLQRLPFHASSTRPMWRAVIDLAVRHGDPRGADALAAVRVRRVLHDAHGQHADTITWFEREIAAAVTALRGATASELTPAARQACDGLREQLRDPRDELLAAVLADPDDDAPRAVYADWLQERGDPRGELIALQLARRSAARQVTLLGLHARSWLGPIAVVARVASCVFRRGFLHRVALDVYRTTATDLVDAVASPAWETVREVDVGNHVLRVARDATGAWTIGNARPGSRRTRVEHLVVAALQPTGTRR